MTFRFVKKIFRFLLFGLFFFFILAPSICQNTTNYFFNTLSLKDGLTQTSVHAILRDSRGFLWIGTGAGLNRFDGQNLTDFYTIQHNKGLFSGNNIRYIAEDLHGNVWISTNKGLLLFNGNNNTFELQEIENEAFDSHDFLLQSDGLLCCSSGALFKYQYDTGEWKRLPLKSENKITYHFTEVLPWDEEKLLLSSRHNGLFFYHLPSGKLSPFPYFQNKTIRKIFIDSKNRLWISPYGQGLECYTKSGKHIASVNTGNSALNNDVVLDLLESSDGNLWIATDGGGVNILNPETNTFSYLRNIPEDASSFPANAVLKLYEDEWGSMWMGSTRNGLIEAKTVSMNTYRQATLQNPFGLSNETVLSLLEDNDGSIWIGTDGGGVNKLNPKTKRIEHFIASVNDKITSIAHYSPNQLLISVFGEGVFFFNKKTGQKRRWVIVNEEENSKILKSGLSATLQIDDEKRIRILSSDIYLYDSSKSSFTNISVPENNTVLKKVAGDDNGNFLYSTSGIFSRQNNENWVRILPFTPKDIVNAVALDVEGWLWLGTNSGLKRFHPQTKEEEEVIHVPSESAVTSLICDNKNRLWIGTQGALWRYSINEKHFDLFGESDGATPNEYLARPALVTRNGDVYLGGVNGLLFIDSQIKTEKPNAPHIGLLEITANDKDKQPLLASRATETALPTVRLPWNRSSIIMRIIAREKDIFRKRIFRYYISNLSREPIETADQTLTLQALAPGEYTVSVSVNLSDGTWSSPEQLLRISVSQPWWKSVWFTILLILLLLSGFVLAVYLFIRKKESRLKWQLKEREQQVYEEKVRFLINISHELRTPLTLIYAPVKRMLTRLPEKEQLQTSLANVYKQASHMRQIINMILDMRKLETGNDNLHIETHSLHEWIRETADFFSEEMAQQRIRLNFDFDERVNSLAFDRAKCEIVLSNLLSNALKFSLKDSEITISTRLDENRQYARVSVSDQGKGLSDTDLQRIFSRFYQGEHKLGGSGIGLDFAKMLIEMHGGKMIAQNNAEGPGATFSFELPLNQRPHDVPLKPKAYINEMLSHTDSDMPKIDYGQPSRVDTKHHSILAVEDNPELLAFLKQHFSDSFKTVFAAANGKEALEIIGKEHPDIVVSDVVMPLMDGFELCRRVKSDIEMSHIPVILLTARSDSDNVRLGYKLGADAYVAKPFDVDFLQTVLENQLTIREQIRIRYQSQTSTPQPQEITFSKADEDFVMKLNALIHKHIAEPKLNVAFIAVEMGMSRSSLYNKMKELLNIGVNDYINRLKLEKAAEMLISQPEISIADIAAGVGFSSQRYFATSFKQYKGVSPSEFRENPG